MHCDRDSVVGDNTLGRRMGRKTLTEILCGYWYLNQALHYRWILTFGNNPKQGNCGNEGKEMEEVLDVCWN